MSGIEVPNLAELFVPGALFHRTLRNPPPPNEKIDRLYEILRRGIIAPALDIERKAISDINLSVTGTKIPYDELVFLHRVRDISHIYTISSADSVFVFLNRGIPVLEASDMGSNWMMFSQDEVYVHGKVEPEFIEVVVINDEAAAEAVKEFSGLLKKGRIALRGFSGKTF